MDELDPTAITNAGSVVPLFDDDRNQIGECVVGESGQLDCTLQDGSNFRAQL